MTITGATRRFSPARWAIALFALFAAVLGAGGAFAQSGGVRVTETAETFTLANDLVTAVVSKRTGDLVSMTYKGTETLTPDAGGHSAAYWSHDTTGGKDVIARVSIDPKANGGERAEVSVKGVSGGIKMGHGPGSATTGDIALDIDTRWALGRDDHGVYTYMAFEHRPEYPAGTMTEARIAVELQDYFDGIHVDDLRSGKYPVAVGEGADKYSYTTRQKDERASGWTSSTKHLGWFMLNPSTEYLSGGPNKAEFVAHEEPSPGPAVLNYWRSSHYGGANVTVSAGERWTRVVGPFMFYVNEGATHEAMVADAKAQLKKEEAKWPYAWAKADGYAGPAERSTVTGQIALDDRDAPNGGRFAGKLMVGLTKTPYQIPRLGGPAAAQGAAPAFQTIEWQNDAKFLQHWSKNLDPSGRFTIEKVPPGTYTLFAYADGVLGEYSKANVVVPAGGKVDLGKLVWTPVRYGRTVWEVGTADRDPREFAYVDHFFQPGAQLKYHEMFPQGVVYRIGKSTPARDWFFVQAPQAPAGVTPTPVPYLGISGGGEETPYRIVFDMAQAARGAATLRVAFTSFTGPGLEVAVNGAPVGIIRNTTNDGAIGLHQIFGRYSEGALAFDAALLKAGENTVTLTVPAGAYNNGAVYDVVRLELDEAAAAPPAATIITFPPAAVVAAAVPLGQRPQPAPTPVMVYTVHDDARFGLPSPIVGGSRYFAQGDAVMVQAGAGAPRRIVDAGKLGPWAVSPDGRLLAYAVAETDAPNTPMTIRVVDTATGAPVAEEVRWVRQSAIAWSKDSRGFYYSGGNPPPPGATNSGGGLVFYHTLGRPRADDRRVLWSDRAGMTHYAEISDDGRWLVINGSLRADGKSEINLIDLAEPKPAPFKAMRRLSERWQFAGSDGAVLYFVTDYGAERGRVVAMDTGQSSLPITEVVPQGPERLQAARLKDGKMSLSYAGASGPVIRTVDQASLARR
jgi:rhamnogalacturonan endolyase